MEKQIVCTVCPRGCRITVTGEGERIDSVTGNACPRGESYARAEFTCPMRILTTSVRVAGEERELLSVRTAAAVPRAKLFECMDALRKVTATLPVRRGDVIVPDVCGTGVDVIATRSMG